MIPYPAKATSPVSLPSLDTASGMKSRETVNERETGAMTAKEFAAPSRTPVGTLKACR